jgi:hypothetical protein
MADREVLANRHLKATPQRAEHKAAVDIRSPDDLSIRKMLDVLQDRISVRAETGVIIAAG